MNNDASHVKETCITQLYATVPRETKIWRPEKKGTLHQKNTIISISFIQSFGNQFVTFIEMVQNYKSLNAF